MSKPATTRVFLGYHLSGLSFVVAALLVGAGCGSTGSKSANSQKEGGLNELNAAHILIMHNESDRKPAHIRRTKEEALKLAKEVAAKAKAKDADFAALAKKYSDGPSATNGGNLGNFEPSKMVKPFTDATMRLEIGEVSAPVETAFGYHLILRKEPS